MSAGAVTDWFDGATKPVREGVYERLIPFSKYTTFYFFDGEQWEYGGVCAADSVVRTPLPSPEQNLCWRGLAQKPA